AVVAQRLVRTLCPHCREPYEVDLDQAASLGLTSAPGGAAYAAKAVLDANGGRAVLYRATGCEECDYSGYRGRTCILELLTLSDAMRKAVLAHADASELRQIAASEGAISMYEDGILKALAGQTTVEEVKRATSEA
ncbi:MAG: hypothetical protein AAF405_05790, partial [Pseudomonadota bacterium]